MKGCVLEEAQSLKRLLSLKLAPDFNWISYIRSIAKDADKIAGSLYHSSKYLTSPAVVYIYKSHIKPKMEYCCHSPASIESKSVSEPLWVTNYSPSSNHSLSQAGYGKHLAALSPLSRKVPVRTTFPGTASSNVHGKARHATYIVTNRLQPLYVPLVRSKFSSDHCSVESTPKKMFLR